ncbi:Glycosyl transferase family 2 [Halorhabdus sp. SVX81]|nr:Glycosyl transferase family 2 [Halorhabdus sp. SVX81]
MPPTVSVVIPTYHRSDLIERAIHSVLDQTFDDLECIVVDDCSPDETAEIARSIDDERLAVLDHEENRGASAARNTGIEAATGEYIAFLDDDDEWLPEKLEKQLALLESSDDSVGLVYCWMDYRDADANLVTEYRPTYSGDIFLDVLDKQRIGNSSTLVAPAKVVENVGGFDESIPRGNDGDFIRRVAREYDVEYVPETLVVSYVEHGHRRISQQDDRGAKDAISGQRAKIDKFKEELEAYPEKQAIIHARIGLRQAQLGSYSASAKSFSKAIRSAPTTLEVYKELLRSVRYRDKY